MYSFSKQLELMKAFGLVGIKVHKVPNERPLPGEKLAGGVELPVQNDRGFLGAFDSKQKLTFALSAEITRRGDLHVVWAEGRDRNLRDLADQALPSADTSVFAKRIPTDKTLSGEWVTKSTDNLGNGVWVISTADSQLQMWEVAVVTVVTNGQAKFYLSLQKVYAGTIFWCLSGEHDNPHIPAEQFSGYQNWYSLRDFLAEHVAESMLKPFSEYQPEERKTPTLAEGQSEVVWYNQVGQKGFARVNGHEKNLYFHRTKIVGQEFPAFEPGQIIGYSSIEKTPKGAQLMGVREL